MNKRILLPLMMLTVLFSCKDDEDKAQSNKTDDDTLTQLEFSHIEIMKWDGSRIFTDPSNPFKKTIPQDAQVHQNSEEMIDLIKSKCGADLSNTFISTGSFAIPIYVASKDCDERTVRMTLYHPPKKTKLLDVPIPQGAKAASASDMHLGIIDMENNCFYEFWRYSSFTAGSGNAISLETDGIYKDGRSTVAAGWSQIQGMIWPKELNDGVINHALSFSTPVTNKNGYVQQPTKHHGTLSNNPFAIPEGTLIRIKSSVDLDTMNGIGEIERIVYRAIQKYGMYCGDTNGAGLAIRAVGTSSLPEGAYPSSFAVRPQSGNYYLKNFPFEHLEVIYTGELTKTEFRDYVNHGCASWEQ